MTKYDQKCANNNHKRGRPKILTSKEKRHICSKFDRGVLQTSGKGVAYAFLNYQKKISNSTVKRALYEENFQSYTKKKKPMISPQNIQKRKQFYNQHVGKTFDQFKNYVFTDESTYRVIGSSGGETYYRKRNLSPSNHAYIRTKKFGGGGLMVWGMVTFNGNFKIYKIDGNMNSEKYIELLEKYVLKDLIELGYPLSDVVFVQDNATCHTSIKTQEYLKSCSLTSLPWPPQSPDMNIIENVWNCLDVKIRKRQTEIKNKDDLRNVMQEEALNISSEYIEKLYQSIPRRINALKIANFDATKY